MSVGSLVLIESSKTSGEPLAWAALGVSCGMQSKERETHQLGTAGMAQCSPDAQERLFWEATLLFGVVYSVHLTAPSSTYVDGMII